MKFYLLTMGYWYYPQRGDEDWIGTFCSREEAMDSFTVITKEQKAFNLDGVEYKKEPDIKYLHIDTNQMYDWYNIIDLKKWIL
jgi:hypothetical protein